MIPVNGKQLGYRIGTTDRILGATTSTPEGFLVLNTTNGDVFLVVDGIWTDGGTFPSDLLAAWNANDGINFEYRIGTSNREIGATANAPEGFLVLNTTNGDVFLVQSGLWADGGTFPPDLLSAWLGA